MAAFLLGNADAAFVGLIAIAGTCAVLVFIDTARFVRDVERARGRSWIDDWEREAFDDD